MELILRFSVDWLSSRWSDCTPNGCVKHKYTLMTAKIDYWPILRGVFRTWCSVRCYYSHTSHTGFQLVPKSVTSKVLDQRNAQSHKIGSLEGQICQSAWNYSHVFCDKNVAQEIYFFENVWFVTGDARCSPISPPKWQPLFWRLAPWFSFHC